jgi:hypothetical protein
MAVEDLAGLSVLLEFADFIAILCFVVAEMVQKAVLQLSCGKGLASEMGKVTEDKKSGRVIILRTSGAFTVGQTVYLTAWNYCVERKIESIRINDASHESVMLTEAVEVGFGLNGWGRKGAVVHVVRSS